MINRALCLAATLSIASVVACSSDPNKNANDAHDAQLAAQRDQQEHAADAYKKQQIADAKNERQTTDATVAHSDRATKNGTEADAKMVEARQVASAKFVDRLQKADAKTEELRALINHAGGKATTQSRDALAAVDQQRTQAKQACDWVANSTDDQFATAKQTANTQLDTLEGYVKQLDKEVSAFK